MRVRDPFDRDRVLLCRIFFRVIWRESNSPRFKRQNFHSTSPQNLKYASISAFFGFADMKILLVLSSKKFVPPHFFSRRGTNLQEG